MSSTIQSPRPALAHDLGSTAIVTFNLIYLLLPATSFSPVDILLKTQLTACIHFGDVPVPDVLDLVANVVECVDHLVQTLGTLHPFFLMSSEMTYCTGVTTMIT